jgi:hypothetical protein
MSVFFQKKLIEIKRFSYFFMNERKIIGDMSQDPSLADRLALTWNNEENKQNDIIRKLFKSIV